MIINPNKLFIFFLLIVLINPAYAFCGGEDYQGRSLYNITGAEKNTEVNISTRFNLSDVWYNTTDEVLLRYWNETTGNVWVNLTTNGSYNISKCWNPVSLKTDRKEPYATFHFFDNFTDSALNTTNWASIGTISVSPGTITIGNDASEILGKINYTPPMDYIVTFQRTSDIQFLAFTNTGNVNTDCPTTCSPNFGYNSHGVYPGFQWKKQNGVYAEIPFSYVDANPNRWRFVYNTSYFAVYNNDTHLQTYSLTNLGIPMKPVFADYRNVGSSLELHNIFMYKNTSVSSSFYKDELNPIPFNITIYHVREPVTNCGVNLLTNLTNLAPTFSSSPGTGERTNGTVYWANDSVVEVMLQAHADAVSETAEIVFKIDGVTVEHISGKPIGGAEINWKPIYGRVPKGSNYSAEFYNFHHYEWRESKLDLDISGCIYPQNNDSLNSIILSLSVIIGFMLAIIFGLLFSKRCGERDRARR